MELGSHRWIVCFSAELVNSYFSDTVFVTVPQTAETAVSEVHKLRGTGRVPTSLTLLFWLWLTVSSVFTGLSAVRPPPHTHTRHRPRPRPLPPTPPPFPVPSKPCDFCGCKAPRKKMMSVSLSNIVTKNISVHNYASTSFISRIFRANKQ